MTQRSLVAVGAGIAVGLALAVVFGWGSLFGAGDTNTDVTLSAINGTCEAGKATLVRVRQGKNLKWEIENYCTEGEKIVMVGNFRTAQGPSGAANCNAAGPQFPFVDTDQDPLRRTATLAAAQQDSDGRIDETRGDIKLKAKDSKDLDQKDPTYYFDLCVNGAIVDPMLIVER